MCMYTDNSVGERKRVVYARMYVTVRVQHTDGQMVACNVDAAVLCSTYDAALEASALQQQLLVYVHLWC